MGREHRVFSPSDLSVFNGKDESAIYICFLGSVYDVSSRPDLYGDGPYQLFAGRECARSLATMSMEPCDVGRTDITDLAAVTAKVGASLSPDEVRDAVSKAMRDWQEKFATSYPLVGEMRPWLTGSASSLSAPQGRASEGRVAVGAPSHPTKATLSRGSAVKELPPGPVEVVCQKPLIHLQRRFLSSADCKRLIAMMLRRQEGMHFEKKVRAPLAVYDPIWNDDEQSFLRDLDERIARLTGGPVHDDEVSLVGMLTPGGSDAEIGEHLGLHVDTNAAPWRFCTALVYLTSVSDGGETVFPAAICDRSSTGGEQMAVEAARQLLNLGFDHTDRALAKAGEAESAANALLEAALMGTGLRVSPEEGTVCVFWTRQNDGEIDPHSWHGGAPLPCGDAMKCTLQKFKEVPRDVRSDPGLLAKFVSQSRRPAAESSNT